MPFATRSHSTPEDRLSHRHGPSYRTRWLRIQEQRFRRGQAPAHSHDQPHLMLVLAGGLRELADGRSFDGVTGSLAFKPAGLEHSNRFDDDLVRTISISLAPEWPALADRAAQLTRYWWISHGAVSHLGHRMLRELYTWEDTSALTIEQLLVESLALLADDAHSRTTCSPPLTRVIERLRDELHRTPSLDQLARLADLHPTHLARAFRRRFGCPIGEWLRRERVQRALIAIGNSERPLSLIALDCGFSDQAHLSRVFRQHLGLPPGRFRRALRNRSYPAGFVAGAHPSPRP